MDGNYKILAKALEPHIPREQLIDDDLRTLAYGTDASFYRLVPQLVIKVNSESEIKIVLQKCRSLALPCTFRAGGTSLSGQAVTDSVLILLGPSWRKIQIHDSGERITLQPGVVGAHANIALAPYSRKIGPDPASINAAMIGGIVANNASGMCCGTSQNSYKTIAGLKLIFADGSILDTRDSLSRIQFQKTHSSLCSRIQKLSKITKQNSILANKIRQKFRMKNTTGYSLNALIDFDDPIDIIEHLIVGSEGTLGFAAEVTYRTVPDYPHKATSLMLFPDIKTACEATTLLKECPVSAVEIMDRASLRSVEQKAGMPEYLKQLDKSVAALLVETRGKTQNELEKHLTHINNTLATLNTVRPFSFTQDVVEQTQLWNIRKGLFPSIGSIREIGTTVIIEDVAFPIERLAEATLQLQELFQKHHYSEAIIFGHALEGNLHFVFTQDFNLRKEIHRYENFINDLTNLVVNTYNGSLKAEHGTGRNMAPFVEMEWGREAYALMRQIKDIFDPENILNPGVLLNNDPKIHIKNLKPLPKAHSVVDKCIECGFCEINCPSRDLTLTPRQRIVVWREINRLQSNGQLPSRLKNLLNEYAYQGEATCATDGLCATSCPVNIDTGKLIKDLRSKQVSKFQNYLASFFANHLGLVSSSLRLMLDLVDMLHRLLGSEAMNYTTDSARKILGQNLPQWNRYIPKAADTIIPPPVDEKSPLKVVYFPSCLSRTLGVSIDGSDNRSQNSKIEQLLLKAGYQVIYPKNLSELCCGMPFSSKGFDEQGEQKQKELARALTKASQHGEYPILIDTSPCLLRMEESSLIENLSAFEPAEFILKFLRSRLRFRKTRQSVAVHSPCSSTKMGLDSKLRELAELCSEEVIVPSNIGCCGFAGDRGFNYPELTNSALNSLKESLPGPCKSGYSTSKTCEIGLSQHSQVPYQSIAYLVDQSTEELLEDGSPKSEQG